MVTVTTNWMNDNFAGQYNPSIHVCAQCHNSRGARWDDIGRTWNGTNFVASAPSWSRGPHNSPQYNILIGIIQPDYLNVNGSGVATNYVSATHSGVGDPSSTSTRTSAPPAMCLSTRRVVGRMSPATPSPWKRITALICHGSVPNWQSPQTTTSNSINLASKLAEPVGDQ